MPKRVVALSNDVEGDRLRTKAVKKPLSACPIASAIDVDNDLWSCVTRSVLDSLNRSLQQLTQLRPLGWRVIASADSTFRPKQAAGYFVADLHVVGHRSGR